MQIFAFHLLNDYSGSPKVLMQLLKGWEAKGLDVTMVTCSGREGFLSNIKGIKYKYYWYRWSANPLLRLFNFVLSQCLLFFKLFFTVKKEDIIYVNTVLPFGAALLGKLKGCRVIYHVHETTMKPAILKKFLFGIMHFTADDVIYVSNYLAEQEKVKKAKVHILYNAIENSFLNKASQEHRLQNTPPGNVLMVCSLKDYKGVHEFVELAKRHYKYQFTLVLNTKQEEIDSFFEKGTLPDNLIIYPTQTNLHPFYTAADIILNLSRPDGWVETFGLTIIEGMAYGLPAIVPPIGGIAELVEDGINGFKASSRELDKVSERLVQILESPDLYEQMHQMALQKINNYNEDIFLQKSLSIIL